MKTFVTFICLLIFLSPVAQTILGPSANNQARLVKSTVIDTSQIECIYSYSVLDPRRDETKECFQILEIGKNYSRFSGYGTYKLDSIIKHKYNNKITVQGYLRLSNKYKNNGGSVWKEIVRNIKTGKITIYADILIDHYIYKDSINKQKWNLNAESQNILGHKCYKATTTFRGRKWTAWYSDIPINNGPWIFGNLPGLILKVEDDKGEHKFEAVSLRNGGKTFGNKIQSYNKTTGKKYLKAVAEYKNNPGVMVAGMVQNPDGTPKTDFKPLFFNPIELE